MVKVSNFEKVSIIIPNYNHCKFLQKRVETVLNQTYLNFEIIILDDSSTDASKIIIENYRTNLRVSNIVYNKVNSGNTFFQWKKGIQLANSRYIWIAESDDFSDNRFLEKVMPLISKNENVGLVFCDSTIINEDEKVLEKWNFGNIQEKDIRDSYILKGREFCFNYLIIKNVIPNASAVVFKKDIVLKNLEWVDSKYKNCGDWKLWLNISLNADIGYLPEYLNYFRKHGHNVTDSIFIQKLESIHILKTIISKTSDPSESYKLYKNIFRWSFNPASWVDNFQFNHSNIISYFRGNCNYLSFKYFFHFLFKILTKNRIDYK